MALYLTHPEVVIDPNVPTPRWGLSDIGRERLQNAVDRGIFDHVTHIISSSEQKAIDGAEIVGQRLGISFTQDPMCDENDRSATGFLPTEKFNEIADQFFEHPDKSILGWETSRDAQKRIVSAVSKHLRSRDEKTILFVGHGAVGTLLKCHIGKRSISRDEDQRTIGAPGGGNIFAFDWASPKLQTDWVALEDWPNG